MDFFFFVSSFLNLNYWETVWKITWAVINIIFINRYRCCPPEMSYGKLFRKTEVLYVSDGCCNIYDGEYLLLHIISNLSY